MSINDTCSGWFVISKSRIFDSLVGVRQIKLGHEVIVQNIAEINNIHINP